MTNKSINGPVLPEGAIGARITYQGITLPYDPKTGKVDCSEIWDIYQVDDVAKGWKVIPFYEPKTTAGAEKAYNEGGPDFVTPLPILERDVKEQFCKAFDIPVSGLKDSGERTDMAGTGALRENNLEKRIYAYHLIPPIIIKTLAGHYGRGAIKYADRNWQKGLPISNFYRAMMGHMLAYAMGNQEEDHLAAVLWNAGGIIWTEDAVKRGFLPATLLDFPFEGDVTNGQ